MTLYCNLGILRRLIGRANTSKLWDLALPRLLVQSLRVTLLGLLDGDVDIDFDKGQRLVIGVCGGGRGVQFASSLAVLFEGRDERRDGDC